MMIISLERESLKLRAELRSNKVCFGPLPNLNPENST